MSIFLMDLLSQTSAALWFFDDRGAKLLKKWVLSIRAKAKIVDGKNIDLDESYCGETENIEI